MSKPTIASVLNFPRTPIQRRKCAVGVDQLVAISYQKHRPETGDSQENITNRPHKRALYAAFFFVSSSARGGVS